MTVNNPFRLLTGLIVLYSLPFVASSCAYRPTTAQTGGAALRQPEVDAKANNSAYYEYGAQVRGYLYQGQFDLLDRVAGDARASKDRLPGGAWKLQLFYAGLSRPDGGHAAPERVWQDHIGKLKEWVAQKPASVTAKIGLAAAYVEYGWHARGSGYANTVTGEGWKLFGERLALAEAVLTGTEGLRAACPHWYAVMQRVALGQGWDAASHDRLFEEATAFEPLYYTFYEQKAFSLLPRWGGRPGEWERFAEGAARRAGGKKGSILHHKIVAYVARASTTEMRRGQFQASTKALWPGVKQGFADLEQVYGASAYGVNLLCLMAVTSGDRPFSRELFTRIGDNWATNVWESKREFEMYKSWAYEGL